MSIYRTIPQSKETITSESNGHQSPVDGNKRTKFNYLSNIQQVSKGAATSFGKRISAGVKSMRDCASHTIGYLKRISSKVGSNFDSFMDYTERNPVLTAAISLPVIAAACTMPVLIPALPVIAIGAVAMTTIVASIPLIASTPLVNVASSDSGDQDSNWATSTQFNTEETKGYNKQNKSTFDEIDEKFFKGLSPSDREEANKLFDKSGKELEKGRRQTY